MELRRAGGHDQAVETLRLDVADHVLLGGVRAGEHGGLRDDDVAGVADVRDHAHDVDIVGDVAAAVADIDADPAGIGGELLLGHAGAVTIPSVDVSRSRWAATWATAAPAWRIESAMSLAPDAAPATNTPGMLVWPGLRSSSGSAT